MRLLPSLVDFDHPGTVCTAPTVVTIGNFDGCHRGHQSLVATARAFPYEGVALSFYPRPEAFFRGTADDSSLLFTPYLKERAFFELGFAGLLVQTFNRSFSELTAERFYEVVLKRYLNARAIVVGDDFHFAHQRQGNAAWLVQRGQRDDVPVRALPLTADGQIISSTRIRQALRAGKVGEASQLLGRPYLLHGKVVQGDQLGRTLGVPTANLAVQGQLIPAEAVYAGYVWLAGRTADKHPPVLQVRTPALIPAVFSVSRRPSVAQASGDLRVEAHLLTGQYGANELYGMEAGFYFTHYLREDRTYTSLQALTTQMQLDLAEARARLQVLG